MPPKLCVLICIVILLHCVALSSCLFKRPHRNDVCEHNAKAFDPKIVCHCQAMSKNSSDSEFKRADCWLHASELREEDEAWDGFGRSVNIKELSFVVFSEEVLRYLPQKAMSYLPDLTKFSLVHADIRLIQAYAFSKLVNLEVVSLINNNISTIEDYAFLKLENLKSLNLSFNQITHVDKHAFYQNYKLEFLHLTVNNITTISDKAFADLGNLIELRMDFNLIQRITSAMLTGLSSLITLTLSANYISAIDEDTFEPLPALENLLLGQNSLQFIASNAFKWTPRLRYIDLEQNELHQLDANLFRAMPNLRFLNLGKNLLNTFEVDKNRLLIEQFVDEKSALYIHENNLGCDCRLLWLFELRNRSRSGFVQKSLDNLNCDLRERDNKPVEVFLLRLHYENFDCAALAATTTELSIANNNRPRAEWREDARHAGNVRSGCGLRIFKGNVIATFTLAISILLLLLCNNSGRRCC